MAKRVRDKHIIVIWICLKNGYRYRGLELRTRGQTQRVTYRCLTEPLHKMTQSKETDSQEISSTDPSVSKIDISHFMPHSITHIFHQLNEYRQTCIKTDLDGTQFHILFNEIPNHPVHHILKDIYSYQII